MAAKLEYKFGCRTLFVALSCLICANLTLAAEFHGLWVDAFGPGFFDPAEVKQLAADCRKYNFSALIVVHGARHMMR